MISYSVVLPAYLEEENLRLLLPRLRDVMQSVEGESEIIIIDTARPLDATSEVCAQQGVRYVARSPGDSFGDAVRTGIAAAVGEWTIFMDADGSHTPEFIPRMIERLQEADVIIASRYVEGGLSENGLVVSAMSRILNLSYALVLNLRCRDVSNSFKIYRSSALKTLALSCQNFDIIEEILFKMRRSNPNLRILEVPFTFKKRMFGETKRNLLAFMFTYLQTMIRLRFSR